MSRRPGVPMKDEAIMLELRLLGDDDSGSDIESDDLGDSDDNEDVVPKKAVVLEEEEELEEEEVLEEGLEAEAMEGVVEEAEVGEAEVGEGMNEEWLEEWLNEECVASPHTPRPATTGVNEVLNDMNRDFLWSDDFSTFTGHKESYTRTSGPTFHSIVPEDIFCKIWDAEIMETIAKETNEYAWQYISRHTDPDFGSSIPDYLNTWTDVTVEELYRYFAVLIYLPFCQRSRLQEYWDTGVLGMPLFRQIMSRNRFIILTKFLHFVNNEDLVATGYDLKISKVLPLVDHCNKKFSELYIPSQHLSLDESLLLWKGRLSWKQCIRTKAARFGIKSFELCDSSTGYLLQYRLYTGKGTDMYPGSLHGFTDKTAKVVLNLMEGYLDAGHVLVMDNWYNQLPLTRYLKSRRTDVLGTINRRRQEVPPAIKDLKLKELQRGESVARHCGDIALVAWQDVKLVTVISTYHQHEMVSGRRAGETVTKPVSVEEYNRYMGGVDLKDQKLSMFLIERKRNLKWYMKVFRRLFNTSLLNAFTIYLRNPIHQLYSHREFRLKVAEGLLRRNLSLAPSRVPSVVRELVRLRAGNHFPIHTDLIERTKRFKQLRCVRCTARNQRTMITNKCYITFTIH